MAHFIRYFLPFLVMGSLLWNPTKIFPQLMLIFDSQFTQNLQFVGLQRSVMMQQDAPGRRDPVHLFFKESRWMQFPGGQSNQSAFYSLSQGGCHIVQGARMLRLICCLKRLEQRQVCTRPSCWSSHLIAAPGRMGRTSIDNSETSTSSFGQL